MSSSVPRRIHQTAIPSPVENLHALTATAIATKELVEMLAGQRGLATDVAVTWGDLVRLGIITKDRIPSDIGQNRLQRS